MRLTFLLIQGWLKRGDVILLGTLSSRKLRVKCFHIGPHHSSRCEWWAFTIAPRLRLSLLIDLTISRLHLIRSWVLTIWLCRAGKWRQATSYRRCLTSCACWVYTNDCSHIHQINVTNNGVYLAAISLLSRLDFRPRTILGIVESEPMHHHFRGKKHASCFRLSTFCVLCFDWLIRVQTWSITVG